jgi:hypothetical protein
MGKKYFLAIYAEHARRIVRGEKSWEFRHADGFLQRLRLGDELLIVATHRDGRTAELVGVGLITALLTGRDVHTYFGDPETLRWCEAGCRPGTERNWDFFLREILEVWDGAIGLEARPVVPPRPVSDIRRLTTGKPWTGAGFTAVDELHRYGIDGRPIAESLDVWLGHM